MEVKIIRATNGYIVEQEQEYDEVEPGEDKAYIECEVIEEVEPTGDTKNLNEVNAAKSLCWSILNKIGYYGDKYGFRLDIRIMNSEWVEVDEKGEVVKD